MRMRTHLVRLAISAAAIFVVALVVAALRPLAPDVSLGALFTIVVLAAAIAWGLPYALIVSVASLLVFNFFFLPPVHTFTLADAKNWTALVVYLVTGIVASELAARARRRAEEAERREREAALLADLAASLLERRDYDDLVERVEPGNTRLAAAVDALLELSKERERLEAEAVDAEALRRSDAVKTAVIRSVSHDLRTPLATMAAALDGLERGDALVDADRTELLETLRLELRRLSQLVENLLDLSRLQAGAVTPSPELWPPDELAARALAELPDGDRVVVEIPADLPAVRADGAQIQRALVNLLDNALKFSPAQQPVTLCAAADEDEVVFRIVDLGPGVDPDAAVEIFEPFHRGATSRGTGLGLAIARGFADANGGRIWIDAIANGTTFALALPAERLPARVLG
jgi:two-component system, OmpR family, sensor histidine kinase KdpD